MHLPVAKCLEKIRKKSGYVAYAATCDPKTAGRWFVRHIMSCATEDLKMAAFKPEYAGKMNFYLSAVDDLLRHPDDKPSIGLILCKSKNRIVAEYALRDLSKPLGISEFRHLEKLPEQLKGTLPTIEELEAELAKSSEPTEEDS